jgi:SnoaL-like domain
MSLQTVGKQFVQMCNQLKNFDVMNSMYASNIVSVEANGEETSGKGPVIEKSKRWGALNNIESEKVDGPFFNGPNEFAVHTVFEVTPKATGKRVRLEEVGIYTVENDKIVREQFFYEGER